MNKYLQTTLLVLTVAFAVGARMNVMGWLFILGFIAILILVIAHFYIHFYAMNNLSIRSTRNIALIILSHVLFITLFLFQFDADDKQTYVVFDYIRGVDTPNDASYTEIVLIISLIAYIILCVFIVRDARKQKITGANHALLISGILVTVVLTFVSANLTASHVESLGDKRIAATGLFRTIPEKKSAMDKVIVLNVDPYRTELNHVPVEVFKMNNLEELHLDDQKITSIPDSIGKLKKLRVLNIRDNPLDSINPRICDCNALEELRVGGSIGKLPDCLSQMPKLRHLSVQSNSVNELMVELVRFKNLKTAHFYTKGIVFNGQRWDSVMAVAGLQHAY